MRSAESWSRVRVIVDVDVLGGISFTSPVMEPHQADILLVELARGPFRVLRARLDPDAAAGPSPATPSTAERRTP